jgi:hypothetical protein
MVCDHELHQVQPALAVVEFGACASSDMLPPVANGLAVGIPDTLADAPLEAPMGLAAAAEPTRPLTIVRETPAFGVVGLSQAQPAIAA